MNSPRPHLFEIAAELLSKTSASRVTIRLTAGDGSADYPVVAEALASGVKSLLGQPVVRRPADNPGPLEYLERNRRVLVQEDVTTSPPAFPEIVDVYGVRAQILAPIVEDGDFVGLVSVHNVAVRHWEPGDLAALAEAVESVATRRCAEATGATGVLREDEPLNSNAELDPGIR